MTEPTLLPATASAQPPEAPEVELLVQITTHLAQLMAREVDLLKNMRIREMGELQSEKNRLILSLEQLQREMDANPRIADFLDDERRAQLKEVGQMFREIMRENLRHLEIACMVNRDVMQAVRQSLIEQSDHVGVYNQRGKGGVPEDHPLSMSLNDTV